MEVKAEVETKAPQKTSQAKKPGILARIKKIKHIEIIIACIAVAVMLIIYFGSKGGGSPGATDANSQTSGLNYCERIEKELSETLSRVTGAGEVKVMIAWESGIESEIAYITNSSQNSVSQSPQIISGQSGQSPVVLKEIYPKAIGVIVLCDGSENAKTRLDITLAVSTLLSITADKIQILSMNDK